MRKWIPLLLVAVLLAGCAQAPVQQIEEPTQPQETTPVLSQESSYLPGSPLEEATGGAVKLYQPEIPELYRILSMGSELLALSGSETTTLTKLSGEDLHMLAQTRLDIHLDPAFLQVSQIGIAYWNDSTRELVFLDRELQEHQRFFLSEELAHRPLVSPKWDAIYYFTPNALRVRDLQLGIDRLVKEISYPHQTLNAILLDGSLIHCSVSDDGQSWTQLFVDAQTGQTRQQCSLDLNLQTRGDGFYATAMEGAYESCFYSLDGKNIQQLIPRDILSRSSFFADKLLARENMQEFAVYDLVSGKCVARLEHLEGYALLDWQPQEDGMYLLLGKEGRTAIALWEYSLSPVQEDRIYSYPRPDTGLSSAKEKASQLSSTYGITILVGEAAALENRDYILEAETREPMLLHTLDRLEAALSRYPEGFFVTTAGGTASGRITLCITRSIQGSPMSGRLESFSGCQFWEEENAYMAIACGSDVEEVFHREFFHVMDNFILSRSKAYYEWEKLNPKGFAYDYDYARNATRDGSEYLRSQDRSFVDTESMSFPQEDRARIFRYAMDDQLGGSYFTTVTMQEKLTAICKGIREAYDWKKSAEIFPWEQFLEKPLAKSK